MPYSISIIIKNFLNVTYDIQTEESSSYKHPLKIIWNTQKVFFVTNI